MVRGQVDGVVGFLALSEGDLQKPHPWYVAGNGPEEDYLSRFFAARRESPMPRRFPPWNYQLQSISLCHRAGFGMESLFGDEGTGLFRGGQSVVAAEVEDELRGQWSRPFQW